MPGFSDHGIDYKHVQPTFGISFALPPGSPGSPSLTNHHPYNPHLFPFGRAITAGGINLGVAIVNPLLSLQITKDEEGEKIYRPLLHFHVTPSQEKLRAVTKLFDDKKAFLLNKHHHYHTMYPIPPNYPVYPWHPVPHAPMYPPPQSQNPHYGYPPHPPSPTYSHYIPNYEEHPYHQPHHGPPHQPPHYDGPPHYSPHYDSVYSPNYAGYEPIHYKEHEHTIREPSDGFNDYYDDNGRNNSGEDYPQAEQRSSNNYDTSEKVSDDTDLGSKANRSAYSLSYDFPSTSPRANRGYQTIRFPDTRKKREINIENINISVLEVIYALFLISSFARRFNKLACRCFNHFFHVQSFYI